MSSQIDHLLNEDRRFAPSAGFAAHANATADLYERAAEDREGFWADQARELHWHTPFTEVLDWSN
ncbi:MAG TPA: acetyl-coenzyme A synthetase N-terminal domain-containing protein, partial [Microbacterium sp.]|uniref:acetyl-coenzyme A synthetase N-terminal domain-containing protein n=1 Tax=Microbacterium sp. TaxID=51671 RepID=UPI002B4958FE